MRKAERGVPHGGMASALSHCRLCPRQCGVDRLRGERGYCGAGALVEVFRYAPHFGEEPPISGTRGSGTVFFSRCTMHCIYCQNYPWSQCGDGTACSVEELAGMLRDLAGRGCHNWNLVSPTPWLPRIAAALELVKQDGIRLPVVYNTRGYERPETLADAGEWVDLYLTDLRYADERTAAEASGAPTYVRDARRAFREMWSRAGPLQTDAAGIARRGVICRLLVLPGHAGEAIDNLRWLTETVGTGVAVSLMAQYTPAHAAIGRPPWNRRLTQREYDAVREEMERLGFNTGWMQNLEEPTPEPLLGYRMKPGSEPSNTEGASG